MRRNDKSFLSWGQCAYQGLPTASGQETPACTKSMNIYADYLTIRITQKNSNIYQLSSVDQTHIASVVCIDDEMPTTEVRLTPTKLMLIKRTSIEQFFHTWSSATDASDPPSASRVFWINGSRPPCQKE